jgi:predicted DNA-binding transcriptional regulator YafY
MRWEDVKRYQVIEAILLWEGRLTTRHLVDYFDSTRQSAQKYIGDYKQLNPTAFEFDPTVKAHLTGDSFKPLFIDSEFSTYHKLFNTSNHPSSRLLVEQLPRVSRNICPALVRPILVAIRDKLRLDIGYISLSSPDFEDRIIQPHSLVFDGLRYHVRAYCEKNQDFRDFVLSRFSGQFCFEGAASAYENDDTLWQTQLTLVLCPDHRLSTAQKLCIERDFQMRDGQLIVPVRAALLKYLLNYLRVDIYQAHAEQQQIVIEPECRRQLAAYLN